MIEIVLFGSVKRKLETDKNLFLIENKGPVSVREALGLAGFKEELLNSERILAHCGMNTMRLSKALDHMDLHDGDRLTLINVVQGG